MRGRSWFDGGLTRGIMAEKGLTRISVDLRAEGTPIDRRIYGHFLEEIGRMISGGLFPEEGSTAPTTGIGYRADVWEACKALTPTILRWPGGCYADVYHWKDGVGPERRKTMPNRHWGLLGKRFGPPVHNELGTDEFLALCEDWGAEPFFCANMGTGGPEEAAAWVAYLESQPCGVRPRLWSIGNEQFGIWERGHTSSRRYARRYKEFRRQMKSANPAIETVANGADTYGMRWNVGLLEEAAAEIDYLSVHIYLPQDYRVWQFRAARDTAEEWYNVLAIDQTVLWKLAQIEAQVRHVSGGPIPLAVDEWNVWWNFSQSIRPRATLRDGLAAALHLMAFQSRSDLVKVANLSSIINVLCPPILTDRDQSSRTSVFRVFRLLLDHAGELSVPSRTAGPMFSTGGLRGIRPASAIPYVAVSATCSRDRKTVSTFLLNRHHEEALRLEIDYEGASIRSGADLHVLTGPTMFSDDRPGRPAELMNVHRELARGKSQEFLLEPRSLAVVVQPYRGPFET
jgi:alpha-N-arabinofuranosidase